MMNMKNITPSKKPKLIRPIGDPHKRVFEIPLDDAGRAKLAGQIVQLDDVEEDIRDRLKQLVTDYKAKIQENRTERERLRRWYKSRMRQETVIVTEHLTANNEVILIRADSGEVIGGARNATAAELQETLPLGAPAPRETAPDPQSRADDKQPDDLDEMTGFDDDVDPDSP
jgi:hypothetical protein